MQILIVIVLLLTAVLCLKFPDYRNHLCNRKCVTGDNRDCKYNFTVETIDSLEPTCGNCPNNETDCYNPQCIVVDGVRRTVMSVNRIVPGPMIQVCKGDNITVNLINNFLDQSTTIHWHGLHQKVYKYMDGVPMITQCPILSGNTFLYFFSAAQSGTFFYHSHVALQQMSGMFGALVVREPVEHKLYDYDLSEHIIFLNDWTIDPLLEFDVYYRLKTIVANPVSALLVNGFGTNATNNIPIRRFLVKQGFRYRFRVIDAGFFQCPMKFQIQNHNMTIISADSEDLEPRQFDTFYISNGERIDFVLHANQSVGFYWITIGGSLACENKTSIALIEYEQNNTTKKITAPSRQASETVSLPANKQLNCINEYPGNPACVDYSELRSDVNQSILNAEPDCVYFVGYNLYNFEKPVYQGPGDNSTINIGALNNISMLLPSRPLILNEKGLKICSREDRHVCNNTLQFCECTHVVTLPKDKIVELVIVDESSNGNSSHAMHLHGYGFWVLGMKRLNYSTTIQHVKNLYRNNSLGKNFNHPPIKDTISVPAGGYVIVRLYTNNEGYWYFHCHVEWHLEDGMAMVFKVGNVAQEPPTKFPVCNDFSGKSNVSIYDLVEEFYNSTQTNVNGNFGYSTSSSGSGKLEISGNTNYRPSTELVDTCYNYLQKYPDTSVYEYNNRSITKKKTHAAKERKHHKVRLH